MQRLGRIDWRNPENLVRLGILAVVIAAIVAALLLRDNFGAAQVGYGAVALSALVASAGLLIPVPALATACRTAVFLNPLLVGLIAGSAESVGELSGYYLGYTGRGVNIAIVDTGIDNEHPGLAGKFRRSIGAGQFILRNGFGGRRCRGAGAAGIWINQNATQLSGDWAVIAKPVSARRCPGGGRACC